MADLLEFPTRYRPDQLGHVPELETERPLFIDWLTIRQNHPGGGLPRISGGLVVHSDEDGVIERETLKRKALEGSYDSRSVIRCDGNVVEFDGNISRFGRRDNLFGYRWQETISRINRLLNLYSLPPFTPGEKARYADSGVIWTGARISRIDITTNYAAFSERDAQAVLLALGQHHIGRQKGTVSSDQTTVMYGYGSQYISGKVYLKYTELRDHLRKKSGSHVDPEVIEFCQRLGVLREEFTLKSRFLTQTGLCWLGEVDDDVLAAFYRARTQFKRFHEMELTDTSKLSAGSRGTLARYEAGEPHGLSKPTFYRHRKEILKHCGIDIGVARSIEKVQLPIKVIEIQKLVAPDWYRERYG